MKQIFMIIDDDKEDRFFFREALTEMLSSAICLEAKDGVEALQQLRQTDQLPDFIFLDIYMPRIDGRECLKELKKDEQLKSIPVIMYSASITKQNIDEFHKLGALSCLKKPNNVNKLPKEILQTIGRPLQLT